MDPSPEFLNVDLEIESISPLHLLETELGKRVSVMFSDRINGCYFLSMEITAPHKTFDGTIHGFCALIERLSPQGKRLWNAARTKTFDIGFAVRLSSHRANRFAISPKTFRRVNKLGAIIAFTLYREE